jgi:metal-sulfur cluster biosynthetic enzyme
MKITEDHIITALKNVPDPELGISVYDLGLYYSSKIDKKGNVEILMTLTTIGCPLFGTIEEMVTDELKKIKGVGKVSIELTFEPPWDADKMTAEAKAALGF